MGRREHSPGGQWEGQNQVHEGVDNHVDDDSVQAVQMFLVLTERPGLLHSVSQVKEHDAVEQEISKFGDENPEIMSPNSLRQIFGAKPALGIEVSIIRGPLAAGQNSPIPTQK